MRVDCKTQKADSVVTIKGIFVKIPRASGKTSFARNRVPYNISVISELKRASRLPRRRNLMGLCRGVNFLSTSLMGGIVKRLLSLLLLSFLISQLVSQRAGLFRRNVMLASNLPFTRGLVPL